MKSRTRGITAAFAAIAATALVAGCSAGGSGSGGGDGASATLTLGTNGEITSWDPGQAHVGHQLQPYQVAYDTLILREPDGSYSPMLAEEWSYNEDLTELTLELRDDVTFSDGAAFDGEAVKANLENLRDSNGRQSGQVAAMESVEVVDADTVTVVLAQPDPAFEFYLSQAAGLMGSPASLGTDAMISTPVGTGPYVMDTAQTVSGSQLVFTAREDYWNPDLQKFDSIVLKPFDELTARLNAALSGQIDAGLIDAPSVDQATGAGLTLIEDYRVDWSGLLLMDRDGVIVPELADVRVRQALNHAIDRDTVLQSIARGYGEVTNQVFGPDSGAYVDELDERYPFDPELARELLADAGYPDGFELPVTAIPGFESAMAVLTQQFEDIGVRVRPISAPGATMLQELADRQHATLIWNLFQGEPWVAINQMISTDALYNPFDSTSEELQTMIEAVRTGGEDSAELAQQVNDYVTENAWFVPFYRADQLYVYDAEKISVEPQVQQAVPSIYNYSPVE